MVWQPMQFLALASSGLARAEVVHAATKAKVNKARLIDSL
jgi:hypothetical protein